MFRLNVKGILEAACFKANAKSEPSNQNISCLFYKRKTPKGLDDNNLRRRTHIDCIAHSTQTRLCVRLACYSCIRTYIKWGENNALCLVWTHLQNKCCRTCPAGGWRMSFPVTWVIKVMNNYYLWRSYGLCVTCCNSVFLHSEQKMNVVH